ELLWGRDQGYWKIVSWDVEPIADDLPPLVSVPDVAIAHVAGDPAMIFAAKAFLQSWLLRKDYDRAFTYLSSSAYACYDVNRPPGQPPAKSPEEAAQRIRAGLERVGTDIVRRRTLSEIVEPVEPTHPAVRLVDHPDAAVFTIVSIPNDLADAS